MPACVLSSYRHIASPAFRVALISSDKRYGSSFRGIRLNTSQAPPSELLRLEWLVSGLSSPIDLVFNVIAGDPVDTRLYHTRSTQFPPFPILIELIHNKLAS